MFLLELYFSDHQFTFFAMFQFSPLAPSLVSDCFKKLVPRIPDKPKLGVFDRNVIYTMADHPETLLVTFPSHLKNLWRLLLEILNKRWQTLDLISMMAEFTRSVRVKQRWPITVTISDSLSSLPRFKRKEELSVSQ